MQKEADKEPGLYQPNYRRVRAEAAGGTSNLHAAPAAASANGAPSVVTPKLHGMPPADASENLGKGTETEASRVVPRDTEVQRKVMDHARSLCDAVQSDLLLWFEPARPLQARAETLNALRELQHTVKMIAKKSPQTDLLAHKVPVAQSAHRFDSDSSSHSGCCLTEGQRLSLHWAWHCSCRRVSPSSRCA
jgi:hypothetical protein